MAVDTKNRVASIDPVAVVAEMLYRKAQADGIVEVEIELSNDDGWYSIPLDQAFAPDCLLPALLIPMAAVYERMWIHRVGFAFPLVSVPDEDAALGARVVWNDSGAPTNLALLCALDVLTTIAAESPNEPVLRLQMAA